MSNSGGALARSYPDVASCPPPGPAPLFALAASIDATAALMSASATDSVVMVGEINAFSGGAQKGRDCKVEMRIAAVHE